MLQEKNESVGFVIAHLPCRRQDVSFDPFSSLTRIRLECHSNQSPDRTTPDGHTYKRRPIAAGRKAMLIAHGHPASAVCRLYPAEWKRSTGRRATPSARDCHQPHFARGAGGSAPSGRRRRSPPVAPSAVRSASAVRRRTGKNMTKLTSAARHEPRASPPREQGKAPASVTKRTDLRANFRPSRYLARALGSCERISAFLRPVLARRVSRTRRPNERYRPSG